MAPLPEEVEEWTAIPAAPIQPPWIPTQIPAEPIPIPEEPELITDDDHEHPEYLTEEVIHEIVNTTIESYESRVLIIVQAELERERQSIIDEVVESIPRQPVYFEIRKR